MTCLSKEHFKRPNQSQWKKQVTVKTKTRYIWLDVFCKHQQQKQQISSPKPGSATHWHYFPCECQSKRNTIWQQHKYGRHVLPESECWISWPHWPLVQHTDWLARQLRADVKWKLRQRHKARRWMNGITSYIRTHRNRCFRESEGHQIYAIRIGHYTHNVLRNQSNICWWNFEDWNHFISTVVELPCRGGIWLFDLENPEGCQMAGVGGLGPGWS